MENTHSTEKLREAVGGSERHSGVDTTEERGKNNMHQVCFSCYKYGSDTIPLAIKVKSTYSNTASLAQEATSGNIQTRLSASNQNIRRPVFLLCNTTI